MPNRGSTSYGPLSVKGGGLKLFDFLKANTAKKGTEERVSLVPLTSAQLLALFTTPVSLVAAPGAGKFLEFLGAFVFYRYGTAAYASVAGTLTANYTNAAGVATSTALAATGLFDQVTDQFRTFKQKSTDVAIAENTPLVLSLSTANMTTGDGLAYVQISYRIQDKPY